MTEYVQARHFTPTSGRQIDLIVVHDMEAPEKPGTAERVAAWFAGATAPRASAHWCFDSDSAVRCVRDRDVAWHAPGANHNGLGYEHAGYARQTREEWLDPYGRAMLEVSARQARLDCRQYAIPVRFVDAAGLKRGERGITTHREVTEAFRRSTHWDPGPGFPMDHYLTLVSGGVDPVDPAGPPRVTGGEPTLRPGSRGEEVRTWQGILVGAGLLPASAVDGVFGPRTEIATRALQERLGVAADGVVGPQTRSATARLLAWLAATRPAGTVLPPYPGQLRRGSRGSAVSEVQRRLVQFGYPLVADGIFGPRTAEAVRDFQGDHGLRVDGIVGRLTWRKLTGG